jgi:hypothetical protein
MVGKVSAFKSFERLNRSSFAAARDGFIYRGSNSPWQQIIAII